jgi:hypothetical protein
VPAPDVEILDRDGELRYAHRNRFPADNPPLEEVLRAVLESAT